MINLKIDKSGIEASDKIQAQRMLNQLRSGTRVFGNPAEGLKITLRELDEKLLSSKSDPLSFDLDDLNLKSQISMVKAGIDGEENLAGYLEKMIRLDENLDGLIIFASLSTEVGGIDDQGYISDTDFVAVYGKHILILDAKNIRTHPENPIFLQDGGLRNMNAVLIEEVIPSTFFWKSYFKKVKLPIQSINGYIVIYNKAGATVLKNADWYKSGSKPIHVSVLNKTLNEWVKDKNGTASLSLLTELSKNQIKKETSSMDLSKAFKQFKI